MAAPNTIVLQGELSEVHVEKFAGASGITPGDCLVLNSDDEFVVQATAGGSHPLIVAKEDDLQGKTIDDTYADAVPVLAHQAQKGDKLYMRLAASQTIAIGDLLEYSTAGKLRAFASGKAVARADEAVTTGVGETARIKATVI